MFYVNNNSNTSDIEVMEGHEPVLMKEVMDFMKPENGGRFLDCTFGGGGHTQALLDASGEAEVHSLDRDPAGAARAEKLLKEYDGRFRFSNINFSDLNKVDEDAFDGVLFDLGVSSFQLDEADRGFSFRNDAPLDLRMNPDEGIPASRFLETCSYDELVEAVRNFGEEKSWRKVVNSIIDSRGSGALDSTLSLAELIEKAVPINRKSRIHPATKTFQGIRIAVNGELDAIEQALPHAFDKLKEGGVLLVISFHSLEDRITKRFFKRMAGKPEHAGDSTVQQDRISRALILTKRPVTASEEELQTNPRSRSAKLRALKKQEGKDGN